MKVILQIAYVRLRVCLQEVRTFLKFTRHLKLGPSGRRLVLFGVPFSDWNVALTDPTIWSGVRGIAEIVRVPAFRFLVRCDDVVLPMKSRHCIMLGGKGHALAAAPDTIRLLSDKEQFVRFLREQGLGGFAPALYADQSQARFPCIVKCRSLSASLGVAVARSAEHLAEIVARPPFSRRPWFLQELISGDTEYTTYAVCHDGRMLWHKSFAFEMAGPGLVRTEDNPRQRRDWTPPPGVMEVLALVLASMRYDGPCNLDYKLDSTGRPRLFEINPRLGGSLMQPDQARDLQAALATIVSHSL